MKLTTKKDKRTELEKKIDDRLAQQAVNAKDAKEMIEVLELYERRQKAGHKQPKISPDAIATIAANLLGIGLILSYEKLNVISTKALGFVFRGRV